MQQQQGGERYRIVLSDMDNFVQCMLATQANHVVHDGRLVKGSILRLKTYSSNQVKGKKYAEHTVSTSMTMGILTSQI
jgi:replication factor A1